MAADKACALAEAYSKEEFVASITARGLPLCGWCRVEPGSKFEYVALSGEWQSKEFQTELLQGLSNLFQYDKRLEQAKFKLMRSAAFKDIPAAQLKNCEWAFHPIDNPQGLHITIASGTSSGEEGLTPAPAAFKPSMDKGAKPDCQFQIVGLRGVSDGRAEALPFNPRLWCARRYVLSVEILNDRIQTRKPAHITIGCFGIRLNPAEDAKAGAAKKPAGKR